MLGVFGVAPPVAPVLSRSGLWPPNLGERRAAVAPVASITPAAASTRARLRRGRATGATGFSGRDSAGCSTALGNCEADASARSRSSGETRTSSGVIGSAGSRIGRGALATPHRCTDVRRRKAVGRMGCRLLASAAEHAAQRTNENLEVEPGRPVLDVVVVPFNAVLERRLAAKPVDLSPAGDS